VLLEELPYFGLAGLALGVLKVPIVVFSYLIPFFEVFLNLAYLLLVANASVVTGGSGLFG